MSEFVIHSYDELAHPPGPEVNFNESVYVNGFDAETGSAAGCGSATGSTKGHAELSVCLYLPGGRIACSFRRPKISANDRFDAGGLSYTVRRAVRSIEMRYEGELLHRRRSRGFRAIRSRCSPAARTRRATFA